MTSALEYANNRGIRRGTNLKWTFIFFVVLVL